MVRARGGAARRAPGPHPKNNIGHGEKKLTLASSPPPLPQPRNLALAAAALALAAAVALAPAATASVLPNGVLTANDAAGATHAAVAGANPVRRPTPKTLSTAGLTTGPDGTPRFLFGYNMGNVRFIPFSKAPLSQTPDQLKALLTHAFEDMAATGARKGRGRWRERERKGDMRGGPAAPPARNLLVARFGRKQGLGAAWKPPPIPGDNARASWNSGRRSGRVGPGRRLRPFTPTGSISPRANRRGASRGGRGGGGRPPRTAPSFFFSLHPPGCNAVRFWLHIDGSTSPEFDPATGLVSGISQETVADLKWVLKVKKREEARERGEGGATHPPPPKPPSSPYPTHPAPLSLPPAH